MLFHLDPLLTTVTRMVLTSLLLRDIVFFCVKFLKIQSSWSHVWCFDDPVRSRLLKLSKVHQTEPLTIYAQKIKAFPLFAPRTDLLYNPPIAPSQAHLSNPHPASMPPISPYVIFPYSIAMQSSRVVASIVTRSPVLRTIARCRHL